MTQAVAQVRNSVARTGFANPLTLGVLVEDVDQLKVYADDVELQVGVDYVVAAIGDEDGVEIEIIGAEDVNEYVGIESFTALFDPNFDQLTDLSLGGGMGRPFETALDQQNRRLQALASRVDRALKVPVDIEGDQVVNPVPGYALGFDEDGNLVALAPGGLGFAEAIVATAVGFTPVGSVISTNVQAALAEITVDLDDAIAALLLTQPLDTDLTAIAALTPADDDLLQRKAGVWTSRTTGQMRDDLGAPSVGGAVNYSLTAAVGSNALTVALKTAAGADPSAADPIVFAFRSPTVTSGDVVKRSLAAALSIVVPSGGTMGFTSNIPGRLWVVAFDDAGTIRLGLINCLNGTDIYPLNVEQVESAAAVGTGSDSAHAFVSDAVVSAKAFAVLGRLDWSAGLATAGAWASAPTQIALVGPSGPLPGARLQQRRNATGAVSASGTTVIPRDDTIPQNTEGNELLTQAITCRATMNLVRVSAILHLSLANGGAYVTAALFKDATASAVAAIADNGAAAEPFIMTLNHVERAATVSAATFKVRAGKDAGAAGTTTLTLNGSGGTRRYGGVSNSYLEVEEIVA